VIRYSALGLGIFYGFIYQNKLAAQAKIRRAENEYHRKEKLIMQAKAEWAKKHSADKTTASGGPVVTDPDDSRFDLEAYLQQLAADDKKAHA
ncbi:ATP synthase E chain-domain-containing protein, partial [Tuber brumale]